VAFFSFLKILFGGGIDATSEELLEMLNGQTYPGDDFIDLYVSIIGIATKEEDVFVSASACCSVGVIGAMSQHKHIFAGSGGDNLHVSLIEGWVDRYRASHPNASSADILQRRILDAFGVISRAAINNPTKEGTGSSYHAARQARLLIDPDESSLKEGQIAGLEILISKKYQTALGFFKTLQRNKRL
jgi:hypothetical protein